VKLPAVAIAAAFAGGIALGLRSPVAREATSHTLLVTAFVVSSALILSAFLFSTKNHFLIAAVASASTWTVWGILAAWIGQQPLPANQVVNLVDSAALDLRHPLRWRGRLRDEPQRLPWGSGLEIELAAVEFRSSLMPVTGGLRLTFSPHENDPALPDLYAGDEVAVICQAKRPQVFRDEGAFDRRAYLATQNIDLIGTLRAPELIQRAAPAHQNPTVLFARARRKLRDALDPLFPTQPQVAAVLRAMLLGDRSFVDRQESTNFQKTGVSHVLVIAGLHVGAWPPFCFGSDASFVSRPAGQSCSR
jgi:predicted membrane metal-binding protein